MADAEQRDSAKQLLPTESGQAGSSQSTDKSPLDWDAGLNAGLIFRPEGQKVNKDAYAGPAKPAYYVESAKPIVYAKAILMACISIVPYFTILDSLSATVDFTPCNNFTCHYMRIFNSKRIPGTGINVIGVQNGVERPVALHYMDFEAYTCEHNQHNRSYHNKVLGKQTTICPSRSNKSYTDFLKAPHLQSTKDKVIGETSFAKRNFGSSIKVSFLITKLPLWLFSWPINAVAKQNPHWGMEHIPSARCPNKSPKEMQQKCMDINVINKEYRRTQDWDHWKSKNPHITNHLRPFGPAKMGVYAGLAGSAFFTALHDIGLLWGRSEIETLTLGWLGILSYGMGAVCIFFWAMGASEVFVAQVPGYQMEECACYYQMPELSALVALSTPFAMFVGFMTKVQMQGLASLYGDYLAFQAYLVPHYMGKQSFLWSWSVLTTPKMAGTIQGTPRPIFTREQWGRLRWQQNFLYWSSNFLKAIVALIASSFMIAFKELGISLYMHGNMTPAADFVIKWVLLCGPSVFALVMGCLAIIDLLNLTIWTDEGETFYSQVRNMCPCLRTLTLRGYARTASTQELDRPRGRKGTHASLASIEKPLAYMTLAIGSIVITAWTAAVSQGLSPDLNFLLGREELTHPKLVQAELWGSCGFVFFLVHVPVVLSIAFSTWDDMESLKHLENGATLYDAEKKCYVQDQENTNFVDYIALDQNTDVKNP